MTEQAAPPEDDVLVSVVVPVYNTRPYLAECLDSLLAQDLPAGRFEVVAVDDGFLVALAEALVLSGLAMATAGSSRPCSGGDHEIVHAIDHLFPGTSNHGELAGVGALFTSFLRDDRTMADEIDACLSRHELPRTFGDLGLSEDQFVQAVLAAPGTRPDRYTILEHLDLDEAAIRERVSAFCDAFRR